MTMNTATIGGSASRRVLPGALAGLAVRAGRALERWGEARAIARPTRDELAQLDTLRREARRAIAENEEAVRRSSFQPLT
jgi:hypothetical protein